MLNINRTEGGVNILSILASVLLFEIAITFHLVHIDQEEKSCIVEFFVSNRRPPALSLCASWDNMELVRTCFEFVLRFSTKI